MEKRGYFLVVEGANGVGKTSFVSALSNIFIRNGRNVFLTKEPTTTELGLFIRKSEQNFKGIPFAYLLAADRYFHIENEIKPAINEGKIVISDRYIASSLALQWLDGVSTTKILQLNDFVLIPDFTIFLTGNSQIIRNRVNERPELTRIELDYSTDSEINAYNNAENILKSLGYKTTCIDNSTQPVEVSAELAYSEFIKRMTKNE